ncbi:MULTISPECIES: 5-formyltetrahydrofolate cyclo-ligase [unclassified Corynebacterium]|uniref:5-formyltetrahydrofolate cyclo-ligase n=1 Tax=unclassified Corynebacterium TaxID=2624378 RepID=UPI0030B60216
MGTLPRFETKPELRQWLLEQRDQMLRSTRQLHDDRLINNTLTWVNEQCESLKNAGITTPVITCFAPVETEPGATGGDKIPEALAATTRFLDRIRQGIPAEAELLLPICPPGKPSALNWASYDTSLEEPLVPGKYGLYEPAGERLGTSAIVGAHIVLLPGIAGDRNGNRMGRGAGYYDRSLELVQQRSRVSVDGSPEGVQETKQLIGLLLHPSELVDHVPFDDHDVPVDAIITADGITTI